MNILAVALSQFHRNFGLRLVASNPSQNPLSNEQFKLYSDLILPKKDLCDRILAIYFKQNYFLVVSPLMTQNKQDDNTYNRQKYIFSLSILVNKADYLQKQKQQMYKQIISRLSKFFKVLEETYHIIYFNQKHIKYIEKILQTFRKDINQTNQCHLSYFCNHYTFINANLSPYSSKQQDHQINYATVPITLLSQQQINTVENQIGRQFLRYAYKGSYTFYKICRLHRNKKQEQIRKFYSRAAEKGVVFLLDLINLNNVYVLTKQIQQFLPQKPKYEELCKIAGKIHSPQKINPQQLLNFYLQFNRVTPLHKIIENNINFVNKIDFYSAIRLAQINGFLKRIQQKIAYTIPPQPLIMMQTLKHILYQREKGKKDLAEQFLRQQFEKISQLIKSYLSSGLTIDQMVVKLQIDYEKLLKLLNSQNRVILQINA